MSQIHQYELSPRIRILWAKTSRENDDWLPLHVHMMDAAEMARMLWETWLPHGTRKIIADGIGQGVSLETAKHLLIFLAMTHDLGKATPAFQSRCDRLRSGVADVGLHFKSIGNPGLIRHSTASQAILSRLGFDISVAIVVGGHHGAPPALADIKAVRIRAEHTGFRDSEWCDVQKRLVMYAAEFTGKKLEDLRSITVSVSSQVLLSALVIMADWLASDENLFPYIPISRHVVENPDARAENAWERLRITAQWAIPCEGLMSTEIFQKRFGDRLKDLRPLQKQIVAEFPGIERPGIAIIEAPMGEGKTEAALAAAEIFAGKSGRGGVFFALPTQATSDGIFPRLKAWMKRLDRGDLPYDLLLAHGKSRLDEEYRGLPVVHPWINDDFDPKDASEECVVVHEWFTGRKKAMLAGFAVGTIDQLLMAGLAQKHLALRHLGFANKVVVIDECHAYDAYMSQYLFKALRWLGAYGVPVIVLSATLPGEKRKELIREYMGRKVAEKPAATSDWAANLHYPVITFTDGGDIRQIQAKTDRPPLRVALEALTEEKLSDRLEECLRGGGCAGIIVNTVKRAQNLARVFSERMGKESVRLLHSRILACDRVNREREIREMLGPPGMRGGRPEKLIVVGTQVMEQSLDVDFDVLFSDLCPLDLLIQRMGRLHRHHRPRPPGLETARCFVLGLDDGEEFERSAMVYGEWLLLTAREIVRGKREMILPDEIAELIRLAYARDGIGRPEEQAKRFSDAFDKHQRRIEDQKRRARDFQICNPFGDVGNLTGWLNFAAQDDASGKRGEAAVRDSDPSIDVIVIERRRDGSFGLLPWIGGGADLPTTQLDESRADMAARCTVSLPREFSARRKASDIIAELEESNKRHSLDEWQRSRWLRGELFLVLEAENGKLTAQLGGRLLTYDREYGLMAAHE